MLGPFNHGFSVGRLGGGAEAGGGGGGGDDDVDGDDADGGVGFDTESLLLLLLLKRPESVSLYQMHADERCAYMSWCCFGYSRLRHIVRRRASPPAYGRPL